MIMAMIIDMIMTCSFWDGAYQNLCHHWHSHNWPPSFQWSVGIGRHSIILRECPFHFMFPVSHL